MFSIIIFDVLQNEYNFMWMQVRQVYEYSLSLPASEK